jgi:hypothetical protein
VLQIQAKRCTTCKETKRLSEFYVQRRRRDGRQSVCMLCQSAYSRKNWNNNRHIRSPKRAEYRRTHTHEYARQRLVRMYGITADDFKEQLKSQNSKCAVCKKQLELSIHGLPSRLAHVDHDHKTGRFRGILCSGCNGMAGHMECKGIDWIQALADYLGLCIPRKSSYSTQQTEVPA